jgi:hypothetical protein
VCGAGVTSSGCNATVAPGYILGPYGDEIIIDKATTLDVCSQDSVTGFDCASPDVWCGDVPTIREDATAYLAVRYVERTTRPVRVPGCGCGCDEGECEYSRTRDSFELKVLTQLPESYRMRRGAENEWDATMSCTGGTTRGFCPPCPADPWVILCDLTLSGGEVSVTCPPHRRYVVSFANYSFFCDEGEYGLMAEVAVKPKVKRPKQPNA